MLGCSLTSWVRTFPFDASSRDGLRQESPPAAVAGRAAVSSMRPLVTPVKRCAVPRPSSIRLGRRRPPLGDHGSRRDRGAPRAQARSVAKHDVAARALGSQVKPRSGGTADSSELERCRSVPGSRPERQRAGRTDRALSADGAEGPRRHGANPGRFAQSWLTLTTSPSDSDPSRREPRGITSESPTHSMVPRSPHRGSR
jgi:hypothetical protein